VARRDSDGSVVFDLGHSPVLPLQATPQLLRHDQPAGSDDTSGHPRTVQRQEAVQRADAPAVSPDDESSPAITPVPTAAPASTGPPSTPAGDVAAGPPLDELARQLFDPLVARLKAELRLDRERAGLLTDMRR
jgi:hypothetical protein